MIDKWSNFVVNSGSCEENVKRFCAGDIHALAMVESLRQYYAQVTNASHDPYMIIQGDCMAAQKKGLTARELGEMYADKCDGDFYSFFVVLQGIIFNTISAKEFRKFLNGKKFLDFENIFDRNQQFKNQLRQNPRSDLA